ncbi:MAG: hypothetical protein VCE43_07275 [Myxococcota bacterium]
MGFEGFDAFYHSDLQSVYLLLVLPALFLVYWWAVARPVHESDTPALRFVRLYTLVFCVETLIDPIATGPMLGLTGGGATALGLLFVLLGDFRVFVLVFGVCAPERGWGGALREAALWAPIVAVSAYAVNAGIGWVAGGVPGQLLWIIHEVLFVGLAGFVRNRVIPRRTAAADPNRARLKRVMSFVMLYYGLWASSDALILWGGFDAGWLLRVVPNQLYYSVWIPFVYATFFSEREGRASGPSSP